jgi:hypothetical protein
MSFETRDLRVTIVFLACASYVPRSFSTSVKLVESSSSPARQVSTTCVKSELSSPTTYFDLPGTAVSTARVVLSMCFRRSARICPLFCDMSASRVQLLYYQTCSALYLFGRGVLAPLNNGVDTSLDVPIDLATLRGEVGSFTLTEEESLCPFAHPSQPWSPIYAC